MMTMWSKLDFNNKEDKVSLTEWYILIIMSKVKEMKESVVKSANLNILNSAILYGRNASGKSNILN